MSTYSLDILTAEKYREESEEIIIYNFENYFYNKYFKVGDGIKDRDELNHSLIMYDLLCIDNCTLINYIQDKIEGKLEECNKKKKKKSFTESLNMLASQQNCSQEEAFESVFWTENLW